MSLLEVEGLRTRFYTEEGVVNAVDGLSYRIERGERFGIVGESGAGKSVAALSVLRLVDDPGQVVDGSIRFYDEATVSEFAAEFPDRVLDVERLREEHDVEALVERLLGEGASPSAIADDEGIAPDADARTVVREGGVGMRDIVDGRYGVDLGVVPEDAFVVRDGDERYLELTRADGEPLRRLRGNHVSMIFQDPQTALNPVYSVGEQIAEAIRTHRSVSDAEARERAIELLERVGIPDARDRYSDYPHQFSGGMQQRVVIAIALSCDPDLLIADEPTTALDVTIEAQILDLLEELAEEFDTAVQLITHDLGVVAGLCDRVMVMYAGRAVEKAPVEELYYEPRHPYTVGLMTSIPRIGDRRDRLDTIPGTMPDLVEVPPGCSFHPRCPYAEEVCSRKEPPLLDVETGEPAGGLTDDREQHVASCLAYDASLGELRPDLDYEVVVREDPPDPTAAGERPPAERDEPEAKDDD